MESSVAILFINHTAKIRYFVHDRISFSYLLQSLRSIFNKIEQEERAEMYLFCRNDIDRTTEKSYDIRNSVRESERKIEAEKSGGNLEKGGKNLGKK